METAFAKWLSERGESHSAYALRVKVNKRSIALLAGVCREPQRVKWFKYATLALVSKDTGIPIETLASDGEKAAANPTPPRRYTRKAGQDAKAAE